MLSPAQAIGKAAVQGYHDPRPAARVFEASYEGGAWVLHRADPDMHQRCVLRASGDRIEGRTDASDDGGRTRRKDVDLCSRRRTAGPGGG